MDNRTAQVISIDTAVVEKGKRAWESLQSTQAKTKQWWLEVGAALKVGREMYPGKDNREFGKWCAENFWGMSASIRSDAMWCAEHADSYNHCKSLHPTAARTEYRQQQAPPSGYRIGWQRLIAERLGVDLAHTSGAERKAINRKLTAAGIALPKYITSEVDADAFVADYVRVIGLKEAARQDVEQTAKQVREDLSSTQQKKLDAAIRAEKTLLGAQFHEQVKRAVDERVASRIKALDALEDEVKEQHAQVTAARRTIDCYMTRDEYNLILNCLHPDRAPEDRRERFSNAFVIFRRLEVYVNLELPLAVLRERGWTK